MNILFKEWLSSNSLNEDKDETAKRALDQCVFSVTQTFRRRSLPVSVFKTRSVISVVAEQTLEAGELLIPLFIRKKTSIVVDGGIWS